MSRFFLLAAFASLIGVMLIGDAQANVLNGSSQGANRARVYIPVLQRVTDELWPDMPDRPLMAAQIEQETCYNFNHSKCWNPRAELKTHRENGIGLGQITITPRFNNFVAARGWDKSLRNWQWADRYDAEMQIRALVAYDRNIYRRMYRLGNTEANRLAFTFAAYNGGEGGLLKDRRMCAATRGCDPSRWLGHVERTSWRAKTAVRGYGKSFFEINREYVRNIMSVRSPKYRDVMS